ncbi:hypothetical protein ACVWWN_000216 [Mycobacterium sp. URHB0021]
MYVVGSVPVLHPEAQTVNEMCEVGAVSNCAATWMLTRLRGERASSSGNIYRKINGYGQRVTPLGVSAQMHWLTISSRNGVSLGFCSHTLRVAKRLMWCNPATLCDNPRGG